jgi:hypothetical protein
MFAYNELSDLINSNELVTPIKKMGDDILCLNSKGEEKIYTFEDFDFDKTIEERSFIVEEDSSSDSSDEEIKNSSDESSEENIQLDNSSDNSSEDSSSSESEPIPEPKPEQPKEYSFDTINDPHWLKKDEAQMIAEKFGYRPTRNIKGIKEFEITV